MALPAFNGQAQDTAGNAVTAFEVRVRSEPGGSLAVIYADRDGVTPLGNPFTPSPVNNGHFTFYAADGRYRITLSNTDGDLADWRDVQVGDDVTNLGDYFLNESSNLGDVETPATAFGNIKQAASDSATGVVEKATNAEVRAATADKYVSADLIESASAVVALTDAATIAIDWDTFINGEVTLTANRTLGNPTNGQPGTWRTVMVKGDAASSPATNRTLIFGNQYRGEIPTLTTIDDQEWYLLMIYCVTTTHFTVSSKKALSEATAT